MYTEMELNSIPFKLRNSFHIYHILYMYSHICIRSYLFLMERSHMDLAPLRSALESFVNLINIKNLGGVYEIVDHEETIFIGSYNEDQNIAGVLAQHFCGKDDSPLGIHISSVCDQGWQYLQVRSMVSQDPMKSRALIF